MYIVITIWDSRDLHGGVDTPRLTLTIRHSPPVTHPRHSPPVTPPPVTHHHFFCTVTRPSSLVLLRRDER